MINEAGVRCFLNLAQTLSFTETARQMYMTQQSVSKYIARLEEDLGFRLFTRTHHYVKLTRAGERYYALFSDFDTRFSAVTEEMRADYGTIYNSLRFGYLEWLDLNASVGPAMRALQERRPELHFSGERHPQYELNELFSQRKLDLIITYQEFAPQESGICSLKVLETPLVLLVSGTNPMATATATVDDFRHQPFIKAAASAETQSESRARALRQCKKLGCTASEVISAPSLESAYMATELGQGVLVSTMLSRMSMNSQLRCYPIGQTEQLLCFWHEEDENPSVESFARQLAKAAAEQ